MGKHLRGCGGGGKARVRPAEGWRMFETRCGARTRCVGQSLTDCTRGVTTRVAFYKRLAPPLHFWQLLDLWEWIRRIPVTQPPCRDPLPEPCFLAGRCLSKRQEQVGGCGTCRGVRMQVPSADLAQTFASSCKERKNLRTEGRELCLLSSSRFFSVQSCV